MTVKEYIEVRVYDEHEYIELEEVTLEFLNEQYSFANVGYPFTHWSAGDVLKTYDYTAFREECNNYADMMLREGRWIEFDGEYFLKEAEDLIDEINECLKDVHPFHAEDADHPGWYYYDSEAFPQGPFASDEACYDHACLEYKEPIGPICK